MATETLRLRFDDPGLHGPQQPQHLAQLQDGSSVSELYRALEQADFSTSERFLRLQDVALQQCQETDESDLQRLRKHFKTLKNTFTVYDLKEGFIDGLLQGLPDGTEEEQLYQFEEEMERNSVMLRQYKTSNEQAQADISQVIDELASTRQNYTMRRDQCAALLQELDDEQAGYELEQSQMAPPSSVDYAALQEQYAAELQAETVLQNNTEAVCAAQQADIQQLEAEVRSAASALQTLEAQVANMTEIRQSEAKESEVNHRFVEHAQWCDLMVSALEALSGVSVASASDDRLELNLTTHEPGQASESGSRSQTFHHCLLLRLDSTTGTVKAAELQEADVDVTDISQAAASSQQGPSFMVREVQARLRDHLGQTDKFQGNSALADVPGRAESKTASACVQGPRYYHSG